MRVALARVRVSYHDRNVSIDRNEAIVSESHIQEGSRIVEADNGSREVVIDIIEAGMGNARDRRLYDAKMLAENAGVFTDAKMFVDHLPPEVERKMKGLPRSIRDLTGRIKESWWDPSGGPNGRGSVKGRATIAAPWLWDLVENDPELVAVSINALGRTRPGVGPDGKPAHMVEAITSCQSVDWVAAAGAGGRIVGFLESHFGTEGDTVAIDWEALSVEDLRANRPDLVDNIEEDFAKAIDEIEAALVAETSEQTGDDVADPEPDEDSGNAEQQDAPGEQSDETATDEPSGDGAVAPEPELVGAVESMTFTYDEVKAVLAEAADILEKEIEAKYAERDRVRENRASVSSALAESGLPELSQQAIKQEFDEFAGDTDDLKASLNESIKTKRAELSAASRRGVRGLGPTLVDDLTPEVPTAKSESGVHAKFIRELGINDES